MFSVVSICQQGDRVRRCDHYLDVFGDPPSLTMQELPQSHLSSRYVQTYSFGPPPRPQDQLESGQSASYWKALLLHSCINFFFVEKFSFSVSKTHIRPQLRQLVFGGRKTLHANKVEVTLHYTGDTRSFLLSTAAHSMSMSFVNLTGSCTIKLYIYFTSVMSLFGKNNTDCKVVMGISK